MVVTFLSQMARVRLEGKPAQKAEVAVLAAAIPFGSGDFLAELLHVNRKVGEVMGWW